jgi:hypothetical protein
MMRSDRRRGIVTSRPKEPTMSKPIRLELTPEQKAQIKAATGKDAQALEMNVTELEQRIAPRQLY